MYIIEGEKHDRNQKRESFEVSADESMELVFEYDGNKLVGTLYLSKAFPPYEVVFLFMAMDQWIEGQMTGATF